MLLWWAELSKSLIHLSTDGYGWVPSLLEPEMTQHWSLPGLLVELMVDSGRSHAKDCFPDFCCHCLCPHSETQPPPASVGEPPTLAGRSGSVSYGVPAPSPGSQ